MVNRNAASTAGAERAIDRQRIHLCNYDGPAHQPTLAVSYGSAWNRLVVRRGGVGYSRLLPQANTPPGAWRGIQGTYLIPGSVARPCVWAGQVGYARCPWLSLFQRHVDVCLPLLQWRFWIHAQVIKEQRMITQFFVARWQPFTVERVDSFANVVRRTGMSNHAQRPAGITRSCTPKSLGCTASSISPHTAKRKAWAGVVSGLS